METSSKSGGPRIVGLKPAGLTKGVANDVGKRVREIYRRSGKQVRLKALQFLPSSLTTLDNGDFQVVANTIVEVGKAGAKRTEAVDSVVTVRKSGRTTQTEDVTIPVLDKIGNPG